MKQIEYPGRHKPKLLLVDDKPENLVALEKVLRNVDADLVMATSGNEALKHMLNHEFALALLDVQMPGMDGYELAELMRSEENTADIPIIFISAIYTDRLNVFKGYEKGAFSFITKPFEPIALFNKVSFFINRYHTEKAFDDSRARYMDLYNTSPDMLVSIDMHTHKIIECNQTTLWNTGYEKSEVINMPVFDFIHAGYLDAARTAFESFGRTGKIENIELAIQKKEGGVIDVLLNATTVHDMHGEKMHINSSFRDISELKRARLDLEKTLNDLQRSNNELENFVYLTSHDLQEPMITVMSFINLLEEEHGERLGEEAHNYIHYCVVAANRMRELITCTLNYLKIGSDKTLEKLDVRKMIHEVLEELQASVQNSKAVVNIQSDMPELVTNKNELKHLFQNFISNAIKFRKPDAVPVIDITSRIENGFVEFRVKDNGIGIKPNHFHKVFSIFKQLHEHGKYEGIGAGMAIAKKIVEHNGGKIWLESEVNEGTSFYFTLPLNP